MRSSVSAYSPRVISRSPTFAKTCLASSGVSFPGAALADSLGAAEVWWFPWQALRTAMENRAHSEGREKRRKREEAGMKEPTEYYGPPSDATQLAHCAPSGAAV